MGIPNKSLFKNAKKSKVASQVCMNENKIIIKNIITENNSRKYLPMKAI